MNDLVQTQRAAYVLQVGAMLARIRKAAGLTQEQLAARLGASHSFVTRLERGARGADFADVMVWARACGMGFRSAIDFLDGEAPAGEASPAVAELTALASRLDEADAQLLLSLARRLAHTG